MLNDDDWNAIITAFQDMENHNLSFESHAKIDPGSTEFKAGIKLHELGACNNCCLLYTSPSPRDISGSRMPSSA